MRLSTFHFTLHKRNLGKPVRNLLILIPSNNMNSDWKTFHSPYPDEERRHDIPCPVCGEINFTRLRNHMSKKHTELDGTERRRLMRIARASSGIADTTSLCGQQQHREYTENHLQVDDSSLNCSEGWNCDGGNEEYKDFVMAIQYPPVLPRERNEVRKYKSEFLKAWKKKSLEPLSRNAKRITWHMYNKFRNSNSRWTLKKSFISAVD